MGDGQWERILELRSCRRNKRAQRATLTVVSGEHTNSAPLRSVHFGTIPEELVVPFDSISSGRRTDERGIAPLESIHHCLPGLCYHLRLLIAIMHIVWFVAPEPEVHARTLWDALVERRDAPGHRNKLWIWRSGTSKAVVRRFSIVICECRKNCQIEITSVALPSD